MSAAVCITLALTLAPAPAPAASVPTPAPAPVAEPEPDPQLLKAQALYREGAVRYELTDYEGAIALWVEAATLMTDEWRRVRLVYNLAEAHLKAHDLGRDPAHLRSARDLYARFLADVQRLDHGQETLSTDVASATVTIDRISEQLAALDEEAREDRKYLRQIALHTLRPDLSPPTRALRGVGVGFTSAGVASLGLMAFGLVLGQRLEDQAGVAALSESERELTLLRGERANHLAIAGAVLGASFLAIGIPTLAVGTVRARRERDEARDRLRTVRETRKTGPVRMRVRSSVGPGRLLLIWEGRF